MILKRKSIADMNRTELEFQETFELLADVKKELREIQTITADIWSKTLAMNAIKDPSIINRHMGETL